MTGSDKVVALILAGGSGTRLWPFSRQLFPKQFMQLEKDRSLLQATADRLSPLISAQDIWVMTGADHATGAGYQELQAFSYMAEPEARNTAPAIGVMAAYMMDWMDDPLMVMLPADHVIADVPAFQNALRTALRVAGTDERIVTFGIRPTRPETGYGYIYAPDAEAGKDDCVPVARFTEKPDRERAAAMLEDGHYFWNSGMFVARASVMLAELARHAPAIDAVLQEMRAAWRGGMERQQAVNALFEKMPADSIDYAVMEKSDRVAVVPCDIGWSDVGSWDAVYDIMGKDEEGNVTKARTISIDSHANMVMGEGRLIALVGVEDLCVIDTADAVLVASREKAQDVKKVVEVLKTRQGEEYLLHRTVRRPWGSYTVLEDSGLGYKLKRIEVRPGGRLSLQSHKHRSEHWVVVAGEATVTNGDRVYTLRIGESTFIPLGAKHRLENLGTDPVQIVEVQVGDYLGEDDIVRYDDVYGR